ncbi:phosphoglucosamine mutase [Natronobacterium gregoryi]|uniref:Phosphoglucosamine mutase n=2 Tax=Natronobacterium gregoryi TaxID=44930 RepID=L0AMN1_NATGS|nr:phosphoglucosamine mutase [Natronobacterium gregoryi]AFZ74457.1 phosphoglucosamine mutase [Natronobacterium gregoryi SP2]ELY72245.1 phosphoglucosamine mutase [Natronobacterium gregoryi SP2]PLK21794.1 phosphoglucosamine mutase [Natronobacterium gregoryi SP2]SFJ46282.1 phosphoglucosamine mutase [Natronobacterium gregoryi]
MFGTSGIRGTVGEGVTATLALEVGRAVASEGYETVVLGRDVRESGTMFADAVAAGLRECGANVVDVGLESTPTIARSIAPLEADAGIVVTASHNPATDNGLKLWTPSGQAFGPAKRDAIERRIREKAADPVDWDELGTRRDCDVREHHAEQIVDAVSLERTPPVVVDVGNGAGGITPAVLDDLGCHVRTLNGQPDGSFPGRPSEPNAETLETLAALVETTDAELGIAHDGDADRTMAVDETGTFVPKDTLLALFARAAVETRDEKTVRVAAPVDTSLAVDDAVAAVDASVTRTRVGDVYVAERTIEDAVVFGGEPSGAWIWPSETRCPDGPLAAAKLVELVASHGPLSELVAEIDQYPIRRTSIEVDNEDDIVATARSRVENRYDEVDTLDGVRVETDEGWFLIRASGTEPLVRITAEARTGTAADRVFEEATAIVERAVEEASAAT